MPTPCILVTNDDGIEAPGLTCLFKALARVGEVYVCAPDRQQSAVSHGVSLHKPLRAAQIADRQYRIDGTPADCVMMAIRQLMPRKPDIVVSGINNGANLGDDVTYSGTVAGAREGMLLGVPSFAVSDISYAPEFLETAAEVARKVCVAVLERGLPPDTLLNVNVPDLPIAALMGTSITRMGRRNYQDEIVVRTDPRGGTYYWIGGPEPTHEPETGTDFEAVEARRVSITPLHRDTTNHGVLADLDFFAKLWD